jgi:photosystem II stability/assembly factor-like uncharacterized protein
LPGYGQAGWIQQQSGTTASLHKVFFVNPQTGWAAGDSSLVLRTIDGGDHWVRSVINTIIGKSEALWFYDPTLGWVADSNGLYKTTDGGVHWQVLQNLNGVHFRDVVFVTPQKGWVTKITGPDTPFGHYMGRLYSSSDGGDNWVLRDSSNRWGYFKISFADSMFGMLAEGYPGHRLPYRLDSEGDTRRTTDGGETWQILPFTPDTFYPVYTNVHILNRDYSWRAAYGLMFYLGVPQESGGISMTAAGGDTWTRMLNGVNYVGSGDPNALAFEITDTLKGYILYTGILMGTNDGGVTWVDLNLPGIKRDIVFSDSLNGWIVGDQGLILHTTDGGLGVWSEPSPLRFTPYNPHLTVFPNPFTSFTTLPGHASEPFALYDISGRRVGTYKGDRIGEGLRAGVYFLRPEGMGTKPMRVVKVR